MVLAERVELDVLDDNHVMIGLAEEGRAEYGYGVFGIAACEFEPCASDAYGRLEQSFALGVFAQEGKDLRVKCSERVLALLQLLLERVHGFSKWQ